MAPKSSATAHKPSDAELALTASEKYHYDGRVYTVHPAAALFPLISSTDFKQLVADIRENGVRQPVVLSGRQVIDGRSRFRAALEVGCEIPFVEVPDPSRIYSWVGSANVYRRHLEPGQRASIVAEIIKAERAERREHMRLKESKRQQARNASRAAARRGDNGDASPAPDDSLAAPDAPDPDGAATSPSVSADAATPEGTAPAAQVGDSAKDSAKAASGPPADPGGSGDGDRAGSDEQVGENGPPDAPGDDELARRYGASPTTVARARAIIDRADDLRRPLLDGLIKVRPAEQLSHEPEQVRRKVLDALRDDPAASVQALITRFARRTDSDKSAPRSAGKEPTSKQSAAKQPAGRQSAGKKSAGKQSAGKQSVERAVADPSLPLLPGDAPLPSGPGGASDPGAQLSPAAPAASTSVRRAGTASGEPSPLPSAVSPVSPMPAGAGLPASAVLDSPAPGVPPDAAFVHWPVDLLSPVPVLEAVRELYGSIKHDPCSNDVAQERVGAVGWHGSDEFALEEPWREPLYCFPPGPLAASFAVKLHAELDRRISKAVFAAPLEPAHPWVADLLDHRHFSGLVLSRKLVSFDQLDGSSWSAPAPLALFIFGLPVPLERAAELFHPWGRVLAPVRGPSA